jgi:hypothetical protein
MNIQVAVDIVHSYMFVLFCSAIFCSFFLTCLSSFGFFSLCVFSRYSHLWYRVLDEYHGFLFLLLLDVQQKLSMPDSVYTGLYPLSAADEVSG